MSGQRKRAMKLGDHHERPHKTAKHTHASDAFVANKNCDRDVASIQDIVDSLQAKLNDDREASVIEQLLSPIVNSVTFKTLCTDALPVDANIEVPGNHDKAHDLCVLSREYEEKYMRSQISTNEKVCINGDRCECQFIDKTKAFTCIALEMPSLRASCSGLCLLCLRKLSTLLFYKTVKRGIQGNFHIQLFGNKIGPGEYAAAAMLICPSSGPWNVLPLPVVAYQRNHYSVEERHGVFFVKQHGVYYEDHL